MRKIAILALAAAALTACAGRPGNKAKETEHTSAQTAAQESGRGETVTGGYTAQRPLTDDEKALFKRVTTEIAGVRYTPESVATQVVAGTNYRFICKAVTASREPETYQAAVTVYQPLPRQGDPRITKIERL